MKYLGKITDNKDLVTKEYVDGSIPDVSDKQDVIEVDGILEGDGEGNISAAETQEVTTINVDSSPTANSSNLVTSGGVYTALQNASGGGGDIASTTSVLKGDGNGGAVAATAGTDYQAPVSASTITTTTTWSGNGPYTQTVTLSGYTVTANTKVDIQLTAAQITQFITDGVTSLLVSNSNGTLTMCATGAAPTTAMTIQVTCTEVTAA